MNRFIRLLQNTLQLVAGIIGLRFQLRPDKWHSDPPKLEERRRVGLGEFRFHFPQGSVPIAALVRRRCCGELYLNCG
jgi:hypothetical protein